MKVKLNEDESIAFEEKDGEKFPVWVTDDGKEIAYDVPASQAKIHEVLTNSGRLDKEIKALKEASKQYEGLDVKAAKAALEKVKTLKDGDFVESKAIEEMKVNLTQQFASKETTLQEAIDLRDAQLSKLLISNQFASSKRLADLVVLPPKMMESYFGKYCTVKTDSQGNPYTSVEHNGNPIYSKTNIGELANFEEAIEHLINQDPDKDSYLKSVDTSGTGQQNNQQQQQNNQQQSSKTSLAFITQGLKDRQNGT